MEAKKINIALDGYSACGKSTLAQSLAKKLQYDYVDSGAMYRAMTLYALRHDINDHHIDQLKSHLGFIKIECVYTSQGNITLLNGEDVTDQIRAPQIQNFVSQISTIPEVRSLLVSQQQAMAKEGGVVMDGRDIGSKVLPMAELKIFMTADIEVRVGRRLKELLDKGIIIDREEVKQNLAFRDHTDSTRKDSPLVKTIDAKVLDNSRMTPDTQLKVVLNWVNEVLNQSNRS